MKVGKCRVIENFTMIHVSEKFRAPKHRYMLSYKLIFNKILFIDKFRATFVLKVVTKCDLKKKKKVKSLGNDIKRET